MDIHEAVELYEMFSLGHDVGEWLNDHFVQDYIDHYEIGSGGAGEAYLSAINHLGDPMEVAHVFESHHQGHDHTAE